MLIIFDINRNADDIESLKIKRYIFLRTFNDDSLMLILHRFSQSWKLSSKNIAVINVLHQPG